MDFISKRRRLAVAVVLCYIITLTLSTTKEFRVHWFDNRNHTLEYNRTDYSECLFTQEPGILKCMRTYSYKKITDVWRYDPEVIKYVAVRCQKQENYHLHRHVCICKNRQDAANPSTSQQHDKYHFCQITGLSRDALKSLTKLEVLDLSDNLIQRIEGQAFDKLTSLKYLDMGNNPLSSLPASLLCDTTKLEILILENTMLKTFPEHLFDCQVHSNLAYMDLSKGIIGSLSAYSLKRLTNLQSLNLSSNAISTLHPHTFRNATKLVSLDLSSNNFKTFPTEICRPVSDHLAHIRLDENHLEILNISELQHCDSIGYLDLSYNRISRIVGSTVRPLFVKKFNVSHNFLRELSGKFMENATMIESLDLSMNAITRISTESFFGLKSLKMLDLSGNNLNSSSVLNRTFKPLVNLEFLDLSRNNLRNVTSEMFQSLSKLRILEMSRNIIRNVESQAFIGLQSLKYLTLCHNQLQVLPPHVFDQLFSLEKLDLSSNSLLHFDNFIIPNSLQWIKLRQNHMKLFPKSFQTQNNVTYIDASQNFITSLQAAQMVGLNKVQILNISNNRILNIGPQAFQDCNSLRVLDLASNEITGILSNDVFFGANTMSHLNLSNNRIESIDGMFSFDSLKSIVSLDVSRNNILSVTKIVDGGSSFPKMSSIDLAFCDIVNISVGSFNGFPHIKSVDLLRNNLTEFRKFQAPHGTKFRMLQNPLICTCAMRWLLEAYDYKTDSCLVYPRMVVMPLDSVKREQFLCKTDAECDIQCTCYTSDLNGPIDTAYCSNGLTSLPSVSSDVKYLHLDGNKFINLTEDISKGVVMDTVELYLNLSKIEKISSSFFRGLVQLIKLDLSYNKITEIGINTFEHQSHLLELHLAHNFLTGFSKLSFHGLKKLRYLDISYNEIQFFDGPSIAEISRFSYKFRLSLGNNPYRCTCANVDFRKWIEKHYSIIDNRDDIKCEDGTEVRRTSVSDFACPQATPINSSPDKKGIIIASLLTAIVVFVVFGASFYYRRDLLAVLYTKLRFGCLRHKYDDCKPEDAFIVYNTNDTKCSEWVNMCMLRKLQSKRRSYKLIVPERARLLQSVSDMETERMYECKCAVFIVSAGFSSQSWSTECFRTAWNYSKDNKKFRIILVIYGDINIEGLEPEMRHFLRKGNYITARSRSVWDRLLYELPDPHAYKLVINDDDVSETDVIMYSIASRSSLNEESGSVFIR